MGDVFETLCVGSGLGHEGLQSGVVCGEGVSDVIIVIGKGGGTRRVYLRVKEVADVLDFV
jgi:hypothetical protein